MNDTSTNPANPWHDDDLGPVAWVLGELRRSLDTAGKCLHRYRREADAAGSDFHVPGLQHLLQAGQLLHQCAGALHLVGQTACAALADAMETSVQRFAEQRQPCTDAAVAQIEQAGAALGDYLQALLAGKVVSPVALFPQFREVQALAGAERSRPVDLWQAPLPALAAQVPLPIAAEPLQPGLALRSQFDQAVLKLVKSADPVAARALHDIALGLAAGSAAPPQRAFWQLAAAYFQAATLGLVPADLYTKRVASGVLAQYTALARGEAPHAAALVQELLFYCAGAAPPQGAAADTLTAVRAAHGLEACGTIDYAQRRFGRFDPGLLAQARKRIATASETWSAVAGGDAHRLRAAHEQLQLMADALGKLHDDSAPLAQALAQAAEAAWRVGGTPPTPPAAALALEAATALLYLETAYADLDRSADLAQRAEQLAARLAQVQQGEAPAPLPEWMEALYDGVNAQPTMDRVAAELGSTLADIEQALDQYFRAPREKGVLGKVVAQLTQVRGVLSMLDLPQAAHAVLRMREAVAGYLDDAPHAAARDPSFERLGSSLAALGVLVGMLGYQRSRALTLFTYDEEQGLLYRHADRSAGAATATDPIAPAATAEGEGEGEGETETETATATATEPSQLLANTACDVVPDAQTAAPTAQAPAPDETPPPSPPAVEAAETAKEREPAETAEAAEAAEAPENDAETDDDHVRQVGPLRIALPLYNAFLNDADEWSRQLQTELGEWALQQPQPPAASSIALARALTDSATGVGFDDLARLADLLDQALTQLGQLPPTGSLPTQPVLDAAEEIRRLLHQFAAGFLKPARATVVQALEDLLHAASESPPHEEEPDCLDAVDADLFPVFEDEAAELLPRLSAALRQWQAAPGDAAARQQALHTLHTLKGSARLAGALRLGALAHQLEGAAEQAGTDATTQQIAPLRLQADRLQHALDALRARVEGAAAPAADDGAQSRTARHGSGPSVRVRAHLLDQIVADAGEVLATRARMEARLDRFGSATDALGGELDRLRAQLRELAMQTESQLQAQHAAPAHEVQERDASAVFDPLELDRFTRAQELTRMMAEVVSDASAAQRDLQRALQETTDELATQGRQARALQHALLRMRMLAFETIAGRLHGVVRQSARELGREVRLDVAGGEVELDRGMLDRLAPVFEHLLRNAVAHGIEDAPTRAAAGKPATGSIAVTAAHEGTALAFTLSDDGRGLDLPSIQARAAALGLRETDAPLTPQEATALAFLPGFTTAPAVTALAGRGIGMDVVRTEVHALGGHIETDSRPGKGTQFRLVLPLVAATTQVLLVRAGPLTFGVPTHLVESVRRVPPAELAQCHASGQFLDDGEPLAFHAAAALLQFAVTPSDEHGRHANVLMLRSAQQRLALHVDEVLGHQEVVVQGLGPQLSRLPGLTGLSTLASGAVLLLYDPLALVAAYGGMARQARRAPTPHGDEGGPADAPDSAPVPLVLVVDDSITVRRALQQLLQRAGYRVALASDGAQALQQLQAERPAVVLTDIEMPRMDGYALAQAIRADPRLSTLPLIAITSRTAERHRAHALAMGLDHHLGKPCADEELLSLVERYAAVAPP